MTNRELLRLKKKYIAEGYKKALKERYFSQEEHDAMVLANVKRNGFAELIDRIKRYTQIILEYTNKAEQSFKSGDKERAGRLINHVVIGYKNSLYEMMIQDVRLPQATKTALMKTADTIKVLPEEEFMGITGQNGVVSLNKPTK